ISSRTDSSSPGTGNVAGCRQWGDGTAEPRSKGRDDRGARATDLRQILTVGAVPVEIDAVASRGRAVGIHGVDVARECATGGAAGPEGAAGGGSGGPARRHDLRSFEDALAGVLEIGDGEATPGPVGAWQHMAVGRDAYGRSAAARTREVVEPQDARKHRLGRGDEPGGRGQTAEAVPELLVAEREAVRA